MLLFSLEQKKDLFTILQERNGAYDVRGDVTESFRVGYRAGIQTSKDYLWFRSAPEYDMQDVAFIKSWKNETKAWHSSDYIAGWQQGLAEAREILQTAIDTICKHDYEKTAIEHRLQCKICCHILWRQDT